MEQPNDYGSLDVDVARDDQGNARRNIHNFDK